VTIPDYQSLMRPLLAFAADGTEKSIKSAVESLAKELKLSDDDIHQLLPSGKQSMFSNRVHWARFYLTKAGALKRTKHAHFAITERGKKLLAENPKEIGVVILRQFAEFLAFLAPKVAGKDEPAVETPAIESAQTTATPEEAIQQAEDQILSGLRSSILERIAELKPMFFERLVVDLIVAMGYGGGSRDSIVEKLSKSADEGIDGIVNEDALGLDAVYLQAKKYAADNTVGRERIQQFAGALVGQGASKGVFVTTSSFSKLSIEYANKVPQKIVLIDGEELTRLMVRYGVGVRVERTVEIKRIDTDYFSEDEE
jgi:restriction system protein